MLRVYSYIFHAALALFLLGISVVALMSSNTLRLPMLPWAGPELLQWLLWGSIAGLISIVLAVTGIFRYLFPIWALVVLALMINGFLLNRYPFPSPDFVNTALLLVGGALLAFLASLTLLPLRRRRA